MSLKSHRNTIFVEEAKILAHDTYQSNQHVLWVSAPEIAARATPGSFAHIQCDSSLPMRRPISIMRADPKRGWLEFFYKVVGIGTQLLAKKVVGETINLMGPIGQPFQLDSKYSRPLLLGGGVGIPPMIFLADLLRHNTHYKPLVLMGSEIPFPFQQKPSQYIVSGLPSEVIGAMPLLENWKIPNRLASLQGYPGCYEGYVTDLARLWLTSLSTPQRQEIALYACGPHPMLAATAKLANEFNLPCQVSLEEFMACGIGGCAGCTVKVHTEQGVAMKRVCVDGPVFDAKSVFI
ncbi:dihydroorotate dehydrogenase electron transfer subunit [Candidatus Nitrosacidococcus sp. I8]|uniref:dihydroorotate dehydrogenase electron transfer subunit n=1 Tax=Candidatus Nitrosacidococcus sp. I8 TaxID=2942908 RepID=UPI002226DB22|nr:dihydroorotate dehydrogenase electron transfer subunit [Candidatus Nitrosacidococcus sp. I8]CAH9016858.1 Dihydroorotate dehydrogenase B (NAD(+)), electron transfer subunit [Candidatus Nitrosacidococcus sp. I8]